MIDEISKGKLTTEYRYHHGYWDGAERGFRVCPRRVHHDPEADMPALQHDPNAPPNVMVSGRQIDDNKRRVVEQFDPFFSSGWQYRSPQKEVWP